MTANGWLSHHMHARGWVAIWRMINAKIISFVEKTASMSVLLRFKHDILYLMKIWLRFVEYVLCNLTFKKWSRIIAHIWKTGREVMLSFTMVTDQSDSRTQPCHVRILFTTFDLPWHRALETLSPKRGTHSRHRVLSTVQSQQLSTVVQAEMQKQDI